MLDDYYDLDFEDVIGGGQVKTRFRYRKVAAADFGLTDEDLLLLDDKQLNKLVPLKKYRPYLYAAAEPEPEGPVEKRKRLQIEGEVNVHKVKNLKRQFRDEIEEKKVSAFLV